MQVHSAEIIAKISRNRKGKNCGSDNPKWVPKIVKSCEFCGVEMLVRPYLIKIGSGKYCSKACQTNARVGRSNPKRLKSVPVLCQQCGVEFVSQPGKIKQGRGKFCSRECLGLSHAAAHPEFANKGKKRPDMSGDKHPAWKGGVTPECQTIRTSVEYKIWRKAVLERDFYVCTACGSKDRLHAHHILRFIDFPHKRFDITNGITLCLPCHWKLHGKNERRKK